MSPPFVDIAGGHSLFVRDRGSGAPVVLLAGWAMDSRLWGETMVALDARGLRTVAPDRRGHGHSTDPGQIDYDLLADDLAAVLDRLDLATATLVAHSGAVGEALRYVTRHGTGRLARLVLVGPVGPRMLADEGRPDGLRRDGLEQALAQLAGDLSGWIDANAEPFAPGISRRVQDWLGGMVLEASRRMVVGFQSVIAETDLTAEAAALALPVTIVHGDLDASAPLALIGQRSAKLIRGATLVIYEGAAHGLMVTHAQRLAEEIARVIEEPSSSLL